MDLIIASSNLHKVREIRSLLKQIHGIDVYSLCDFPNYTPPEETGKTFEENAVLKATHAAKTLHKLALADDSGLAVPALHYAPGVYSQRYAHENASDAENRKKLLKELEGKKGLERSGYFECCIAIADQHGSYKCFTGRCEGLIGEKEQGGNGFGYDPLFRKYDYEKTFAELNEETKNRISHRGKAFDQAKIYLLQIVTRISDNPLENLNDLTGHLHSQ